MELVTEGSSLVTRLSKGLRWSSDGGRLATPRSELGRLATALTQGRRAAYTRTIYAQCLRASVWTGLLHWIPGLFPWSLGPPVGSRLWRLVLWKFWVRLEGFGT